jgi:alpha-L-fucosidase
MAAAAMRGEAGAGQSADAAGPAGAAAAGDRDRERRMRWWHEAKFGMFIHWGLYSVLGRHEWAMEMEAIPWREYERLADGFLPRPGCAREWARLARRAGPKYVVLTTKHHEGFCLWDTETTSYCAPKRAAGRDLIREYVDAAREEGLRVGFYYSLMDWHHPDGARAEHDPEARRRLVDYAHAQVRELMTGYGRIDVLWWDVQWPLDAEQWESERMNEMVFSLQPDVVMNNRNTDKRGGDFSTPEQRIEAEQERAWEACMTLNSSWGYHATDDSWKSPKQVLRNLFQCARDGGNYLLNVGPRADGSVPGESVEVLETVGAWLARNGEAVYGAERCQLTRSRYAMFTRRGHTLYMNVHFWPGDTAVICGLETPVRSARLLATGQSVAFTQDRQRTVFEGLPREPPDSPVTTIAIECDGVPEQDQYIVRRERERPERA